MNETALRLLNPDEKQSKQKNLVKSDNFVCLQGWMITELHLKGASLIIYAIIYSFSQDNSSYFQGSASYLSEWASVSVYTVYDILKKLCQLNLIEKIEENINGVKVCNYRSKRTPPVVKDHHPGDKRTPPPVIKDQLDNIDNNIVNNINNKKTIQKSATKEQDGVFNRFWELYPRQRRGGKEDAFRAWNKALKREDITREQILETVKVYANSDEVKRGYAKGCAAWLNGSCFLNEYQSIKATSDINPVLEYMMKEYEPKEMLKNSILKDRYIRKHSSSADELLDACEGNVERAKQMIDYYVDYIKEKGKEFFLWDVLNNFCRIHDALKFRKGGKIWEIK